MGCSNDTKGTALLGERGRGTAKSTIHHHRHHLPHRHRRLRENGVRCKIRKQGLLLLSNETFKRRHFAELAADVAVREPNLC